jgi:hypothetical protein
MKIRDDSRASRTRSGMLLLGLLVGAWGCGDTPAPTPGMTEDSKAKEEAERKARQAAYGSKGQIGKEAPKQ